MNKPGQSVGFPVCQIVGQIDSNLKAGAEMEAVLEQTRLIRRSLGQLIRVFQAIDCSSDPLNMLSANVCIPVHQVMQDCSTKTKFATQSGISHPGSLFDRHKALDRLRRQRSIGELLVW
ncbi:MULTISPECIES: hypothetical protein [unclassified Mesorhizobium]|uniref:hypothetical protein n=1 Tax=unclassified Mesorhizobium TaxID=325217 RepID=UPI000BB02668|nr:MULTISPECIES: hypothetical protein [unclassified Mesorhizobium]PBC21283.1 hypothetical protein CK226_20845 [Mesorhizobium sp. WSM4311]TRD04789.1 hypothetical protein FJV82_13100 [Mesorhizobium sp. WSM4305]